MSFGLQPVIDRTVRGDVPEFPVRRCAAAFVVFQQEVADLMQDDECGRFVVNASQVLRAEVQPPVFIDGQGCQSFALDWDQGEDG